MVRFVVFVLPSNHHTNRLIVLYMGRVQIELSCYVVHICLPTGARWYFFVANCTTTPLAKTKYDKFCGCGWSMGNAQASGDTYGYKVHSAK